MDVDLEKREGERDICICMCDKMNNDKLFPIPFLVISPKKKIFNRKVDDIEKKVLSARYTVSMDIISRIIGL